MSAPILVMSVADAIALAQAIPDVVSPGGVKRRAMAFENSRNGAGWRTQFPREGSSIVDGETLKIDLAPITFDPEQLATATVQMTHPDGRVFAVPVLLVQAIAGWLYVAIERGDLVLPQPAAAP